MSVTLDTEAWSWTRVLNGKTWSSTQVGEKVFGKFAIYEICVKLTMCVGFHKDQYSGLSYLMPSLNLVKMQTVYFGKS